MGTPDFAVEPLRAIINSGYEVVAVVTMPDKPAGRGQILQSSPVKKFAIEHNIPLLQPVKLRDPIFVNDLKALKANLIVVVAFRMLPEQVWQMPEFGTLNLHASLLPQYRGAAPINHAIMNGETETGVTTFFIEKEIDTGKIILSAKVSIAMEEDAGALHDKLMHKGSKLIIDTLERIVKNEVREINQTELVKDSAELKLAPKIYKENCQIDWNKPVLEIYNKIRGLSPYPGAFTSISMNNTDPRILKIFKCSFESIDTISETCGKIYTDNKTYLKISGKDGFIHLEELQLEGKKRISCNEFLRGYPLNNAILI